MKRLMAVLLSLMFLPVVTNCQINPAPQESTPVSPALSSTLQPILGEWNFGICGPEEYTAFHGQIVNDKDGARQTFSYAMTGAEVQAMGKESLSYNFQQVTVLSSGEVQYVLTHTYLNRETKKRTLDSQINESLYNGHLLGMLIAQHGKTNDQDQQSDPDYFILFASQGTLDQHPAFAESGLSLCKVLRAQSDEDATQSIVDWADGKALPPVPDVPPAPKTLPVLPPTKEQK